MTKFLKACGSWKKLWTGASKESGNIWPRNSRMATVATALPSVYPHDYSPCIITSRSTHSTALVACVSSRPPSESRHSNVHIKRWNHKSLLDGSHPSNTCHFSTQPDCQPPAVAGICIWPSLTRGACCICMGQMRCGWLQPAALLLEKLSTRAEEVGVFIPRRQPSGPNSASSWIKQLPPVMGTNFLRSSGDFLSSPTFLFSWAQLLHELLAPGSFIQCQLPGQHRLRQRAIWPCMWQSSLWSYRAASGKQGSVLEILSATYLLTSISNNICTCHLYLFL
jgi:hypothetical protein